MARVSKNTLTINNLWAGLPNRQILRGVNLMVRPGRITAIMGPNGSGKSTLASVLAGHPGYRVLRGSATFGSTNILKLKPHERARRGLFVAFQYPVEVPGVSFREFLWTAFEAVHGKPDRKEFDRLVKATMTRLKLSPTFLDRAVNEGLSGGEKKKAEILQLSLLSPAIAILDETDSGLDIDALRLIARHVRRLVSPRRGFLVITHYQRLLNHLKPDTVHILAAGRVVASGGFDLVRKVERLGYEWLEKTQ